MKYQTKPVMHHGNMTYGYSRINLAARRPLVVASVFAGTNEKTGTGYSADHRAAHHRNVANDDIRT